jgi:hypothetical protein
VTGKEMNDEIKYAFNMYYFQHPGEILELQSQSGDLQ